MIRFDFHIPIFFPGHPKCNVNWSLMFLCSLVLGLLSFGNPGALGAEAFSPRQRLSFNSDWLFIKGDPTNSATNLDYQTVPPVKLDYQTLKPWLLPIGADLTTNSQPT